MDAQELKNSWQDYDRKLEQALHFNYRCIEAIQSLKAKSKLKQLLIYKILELLFAASVTFFLGNFIFQHIFEVQFTIPAIVLLVFSVTGLVGSVSQISMIGQINYTENVTEIQRRLALLQSSVIRYIRLSILSLPFYTAYIIIGFKVLFNADLVTYGSHAWWEGQFIVSALFIPVTVWLCMQLSSKNMSKGWVRTLIENAGGKSVAKAMEFLKEIEEFKKD